MVLERRFRESIDLDIPGIGTVVIKVMACGLRPKIGIEAPQTVRIRRSELPRGTYEASAEPVKGGAT